MNDSRFGPTEIHCTHHGGCYDAPIGGPYGISEALVAQCIAGHEHAFRGHKVVVRERD